jgi:pimeloyl-ACP methyl ester carboxylesterase
MKFSAFVQVADRALPADFERDHDSAVDATLIIWGAGDALIPAGYAREFGAAIANSRVEIVRMPDTFHRLSRWRRRSRSFAASLTARVASARPSDRRRLLSSPARSTR